MPIRAQALVVLCVLCGRALAQAVVQDYPDPLPPALPAPSAIAAAALSGWHATASTVDDTVVLQDTAGVTLRTLPRSRLAALAPWMSLDTGTDGPHALAFSDSGRLLFIMLRDASPAQDGQGSDVILRYDTQTDQLTRFSRHELTPAGSITTPASLAHFEGKLFVGLPGLIEVKRAQANDQTGVTLSAVSLGSVNPIAGMSVDRVQRFLFFTIDGYADRFNILPGSTAPFLGSRLRLAPGASDLVFAPIYGGTTSPGLYLALGSQINRLTLAQARGNSQITATAYTTLPSNIADLAASCDGSLLAALSPSARRVTDASDARMPLQSFLLDEFGQVVNFARSLVTVGPNSGPAGTRGVPGFVIDADVQQGWTRFHPASPDAAAWTILLLLASDDVRRAPGGAPGSGDAAARNQVAQILTRYAGLSPDGIVPLRSADGIYWHWINPNTGGPQAGWGDSYSTLSTMKMVAAAARAREYFAGDAQIGQAARAIICGVKNHDAYFQLPAAPVAMLGEAGGGPAPNSYSWPFNETVIFVEQANVYGGAVSDFAWFRWSAPANLPSATYVAGAPVTGDSPGNFLPAFASLYSLLLQPTFRTSGAWLSHYRNLKLSNMAWTDDAAPLWNTVFSAGTTKSAWGGYHADNLLDHPGDVTTFPSLAAFSADPASINPRAEVGALYHAYRTGARQTFLGGASILYRRSSEDAAYQPDSAGLPDVALGALGLAELLSPGFVDRVLARGYPSCAPCPSDLNYDGFTDDADFVEFAAAYEAFVCAPSPTPAAACAADLNADGFVDDADFVMFASGYEAFVCP